MRFRGISLINRAKSMGAGKQKSSRQKLIPSVIHVDLMALGVLNSR